MGLKIMIVRLAERDLRTKFGVFREILYYDGQRESIAIVMGDITGGEDVLCRVHAHCVGAHLFNSIECECREEMERAQRLIQKAGRGIVIWLDQEAKGNGHLALIKSTEYKLRGIGQSEAYEMAGYVADARNYKPAASILRDLGVLSISLLTNGIAKADRLRAESITVTGTVPLDE